MLKIILKRVLQIIPILFIVVTLVFGITRVIPGDPAAVMLGPQASADEVMKLRDELGLNDSISKQYGTYMKGLLKGDLGKSYSYSESVGKLIKETFPNTLILASCSIVLALFIGIPLGIISATKQYSIFDYISMIAALIGVSMPIFWLGLMLVLVFSVNLGWLPSMGMGSMDNGIGDVISHLVLPTIALSTIPSATFARITRSSMLESVKQDYVKALRAKGLSERVVIWKHVLKNALPPIITVLGLQISSALSGAILTETIFNWPGMGKLIVDAIGNRDYALVQGAVLFIAVIYVAINLLVDIVYMYINPKVSYDSVKGGS
ncbi:ABC transporter permease subunit [Clostridium bovifaecis]|uniref:ABC transporter permease subunit n=1 Tax=Clostridium bovifaecis TaxID=2184719 RepID=A0A6I6F4N0_9CLOT|nr:ABC transporter permease subunit [Clostridium bovifaecis]